MKPTESHLRESRRRARDDFSLAVKELLAKRVAYRCSNPGCCQATSGPRQDSDKAINIGVAAHITAASQGGPRYDPLLASDARSASENGIWLCQICGKLVDNDPVRYTTLRLKDWKRVAEARAARALENRWTLDTARDGGSSKPDHLPDLALRVTQFLAAHRRYCARLPYLSLGSESFSKSLDDVYIPARLRRKAPFSDDKASTDELSISDVLLELERQPILISGWPGSGKSTILRHVASRIWHSPEDLGLRTPYLPMLVPAYRLAKTGGSLETRLREVVSDEYALEQDLPEGFMSAWSQHVEAKWLLMVDGLDQVSLDYRLQFLSWLESISASSGNHRVLFSCRSQSIDVIRHIVAASSCEEFEVSPLSPTEVTTLAANWIPTTIGEFDEQFERISDSDIRHTPLITTLAALVFREKGTLPERRAQLYEMFVDISLEEARLQGLLEQLDPKIRRAAKSLLAFTATAITNNESSSLAMTLGSFVTNKLGFSQEDANGAANEFLEVMAERSGVFARVGSSYDFLHPTFRQYLSAFHIAHQAGNDIRVLRLGLYFLWVHPAWHEAVVFLSSIVSERPDHSDTLMRYLYDQCKWLHRFGIHTYKATYNLFLLTECLIEGVVVSEATRQRIFRALLKAARSTRTDFTMRVLLTRNLVALKQIPEAQRLLPSLMRDARATHDAKVVIVQCLSEVKCVSELLEVACDQAMEDSIRRIAVSALGSLRDVRALVEIFIRLGPINEVSDKAFNELFVLAPYAELEAIATSALSGAGAQVTAVLLLTGFGQMKMLLSIACNQSAPIKVRSCSLLSLINEKTGMSVSEELTDPETRLRLQPATVALLEHLRGLGLENAPLMSEEIRASLVRLFSFVFGESNLLLDDNSNLGALVDKSISYIRNRQADPLEKM